MKSKIKILFTVFLCSISSVLIAQSVDINMATAVAKRHLAAISRPSLKSTASRKNFQFTSVKATVENNDTLYYILNDTINKGFVIVSADKRAWPILGYSTERSFNEKNQPEAFTAWMENRKQEIAVIKLNNSQPDSVTTASWQNLNLKSAAIETTSVEPLIQTQWDQRCYYNAMCPADLAGPCGHVPTGCTITAMAQIMKYWNYPTKGTGSHSYSHPTYGNLSADFGSTTYQWNQMPNVITSKNDAVATLMYHLGVSLDTDYSLGGSGAFYPREAFVDYFNYSPNALWVNRSSLKTNEWIKLLKSELDLQHPIWYTGGDSIVGHSFVCDGYQDADYFHFNWGWSGSCDGYYYIGNLNPSGYSLNENQFALINIIPGSLPDGYNGIFLSSNTLGVGTKGGAVSIDVCSSVNWKASSNQSWLSLSTNTGISGKTNLSLTASENPNGSDRSAKVTISAAGFPSQTITVNQPTKKFVTPDGLQSLIDQDASTISNLTLSGSIDARDFKTMRDAMPKLTDINLEDVTIVAYTGSEGTNSGNYVYKENTVPPLAFNIVQCKGQSPLKTIVLPATTKSIEFLAFASCKYLTAINIPELVNNINCFAFQLTNASINVDLKNSYFSSVDGVLFNKNKTTILHCPVLKTGDYLIPASVASIGERAFDNCNKIATLTIPSSVTSIGGCAFIGCNGLTAITVPSTVSSIESEAFHGCSALINVDPNNLNYSSIDGVLFNKTQTKLIQCPISKKGMYSIHSSVTSIGGYAFANCSGLTNVMIPASVKTIEMNAFQYCGGLNELVIPSTVSSIEYGIFSFCTGLRSVTISSSVVSIGGCAFSDCRKLSSISVYPISPVNLISSWGVFYNVDKTTCTLYVPYSSKTQYAAADQWKDFTNIVEMPGFRLSATTANVNADQGSTGSIDLSSNVACSVSSNQSWLKASLSATTSTNSITFEATENPEKVYRSAIVTVSAEGVESQTITITQEAKNITGIDKLSKTSEFKVYPNPTTGKIKLIFERIPLNGISVTIDDISGKNCLKQKVHENEVWLDLKGNAPGIYFIKTDQENLKAQKVILK